MSLFHSPSIVRSNLSLHFDPYNVKSYLGSGSTFYDMSGNGNNATLYNTPSWAGPYFTLNGSNNYIVPITNNVVLSGDFTVDFWMYNNSTTSGYAQMWSVNGTCVVRFGDSGFGDRLQFGINMSTLSGCWSTSYTRTTTYQQWLHIVWTRISGVNQFYVNGVLQSLAQGTSNSYSVTSFTDASSVTITVGSAYYGNTQYNGRLSALKVYSGLGLSSTQVLQNFSALRGRFGI